MSERTEGDGRAAWRTMESAPKAGEGFFIGWLHLEKNPQASAATIVSRVYRPEDVPREDVAGGEVAEWFCVNGTYYPARYVTHWMPLPEPPLSARAPQELRPASGRPILTSNRAMLYFAYPGR